eukprot:Lankesteria_metandrocarpae@DN5324_c0_g1_i1.p1
MKHHQSSMLLLLVGAAVLSSVSSVEEVSEGCCPSTKIILAQVISSGSLRSSELPRASNEVPVYMPYPAGSSPADIEQTRHSNSKINSGIGNPHMIPSPFWTPEDVDPMIVKYPDFPRVTGEMRDNAASEYNRHDNTLLNRHDSNRSPSMQQHDFNRDHGMSANRHNNFNDNTMSDQPFQKFATNNFSESNKFSDNTMSDRPLQKFANNFSDNKSDNMSDRPLQGFATNNFSDNTMSDRPLQKFANNFSDNNSRFSDNTM